MLGRVRRIDGNTLEVLTPAGRVSCRLAGRLGREKLRTLVLAAVGDEVEVEKGLVIRVLPRSSKLSRHDVGNPHREQVLAANVDRILITQSLVSPGLNPMQIDRCLVMALGAGIEFAIIVNKVDLFDATAADEMLRPYRALGYAILFTSAPALRGRDELRSMLRGRVSVFLGPSGVGKSSLLNMLSPSLDLKTGDVSSRTGEGTHTTSRAEWLDLGDGMDVIDTPGLEFFTLWGVGAGDLSGHFEEFSRTRCRFPDCRHLREPACGVAAAVERGEVSPARFDSYLRILDELSSKRKFYRREGRRPSFERGDEGE